MEGEKKTVEKALKESEEKYRLMMDSIADYAIFILDDKGHIISWNKGAEHIKGYKAEEIIGKHFSCFYTEEDIKKGEPEKELKIAARKGKFEGEGWRIRKDGSQFWANVVITALKDEKLRCFVKVVQDLTEYRKMIEALKKEREKYRMLFEKSPEAIVIVGLDGEILDCNKAALNFSGLSKKDIIGKNFMEMGILSEEDLPNLIEQSHKAIKGEKIGMIELKTQIRDKTKWLEVFPSVLKRDGKPYAFQTIVRDITDKKEAEERVKKSNRMFKVLYRCNEALVYAKNEKELLDEICKIVVEDGGYLLAWVGYTKKGKKVYAVAAAGEHVDYVKKVKITWNDSKTGRGPTGIAIKTEKPSVARDIEHEIYYTPWKKEAMEHGFKSSISLPLIANGKTIGALNIYSAEKDAFDTEEVNLLSQLADDLAYGIFALRNKAERKRAEKELVEERNLFIGGPVVVFKWKAGEEDIPVEYVSPNVRDVFGYEPTEFTSGKIIYDDIIHPDDLERVIEEARSYRRRGLTHFDQEYRIISANGKYRWVHDFTIVKKDIKGKITHYYGYLVDITKRKKMEEDLEKEREQFLSIFEGIDEPIYVVDPNTHEILYVNEVLEKVFGKNIVGKKCHKVFQNLDKPCDFCTNDKIFGKNFGKTYIWEHQNKINKRWYRCIDRGIIWPDGRKVRLEIAMDITDKIKAEEEMMRALEQERKFKLEAAHYFFNPIAIAKGYLDLAIEELPQEQREKLKAAHHAIERVEKVVKNVVEKGEIHE